MSSSYSVFIPRVFTNIREERIKDIFDTKRIGKVSSVDLISKKNQKGDTTQYYNMAFVHFERLYDTDEALTFRREVDDPNTKAKLVYEDPWFWVVLPFEQKEKHTPTTETSSANVNMGCFNDSLPYNQLPPRHIMSQHPPTHNMVTFGTEQPLLPFWIMTPHGPMWQWGYAPHPNMMIPPPPLNNLNNEDVIDNMLQHYQQSKPRINNKMIPPQVLYGNRSVNQRHHPKKRIDVGLMRQKNDEKEEGEC